MLKKTEIREITAAALDAGKVIFDYYNNKNYEVKFKKPHDPVTSADMEANEIISRVIERLFPEDLIVSEETYIPGLKTEIDRKREKAGRIWIIDPLDGTKDFIKGIPFFGVSIGFLNQNEARFGVVYNPARNFLISGGPDYGISLNGKPVVIEPATIKKIDHLKVCVSKSEARQNLFHDILKAIPDENITYIGSVAYKLGLLVTGEIDLVLSRRHKSDWDIAGALAILSAAGFTALDRHFEPIHLNKKSITTDGLVVGRPESVKLYRSFLGRL